MENNRENTAPVGVFDSGVGGLTVAREIMSQLPMENVVYFGDTARGPYGSKSRDNIIRFSRQIIRFLETKNVKAIVIACNTASALALDTVQKETDVPVIGVIGPGARAAVKETRNGQIGVVGTEATIQSETYTKVIHSLKHPLSESHARFSCRLWKRGLQSTRLRKRPLISICRI